MRFLRIISLVLVFAFLLSFSVLADELDVAVSDELDVQPIDIPDLGLDSSIQAVVPTLTPTSDWSTTDRTNLNAIASWFKVKVSEVNEFSNISDHSLIYYIFGLYLYSYGQLSALESIAGSSASAASNLVGINNGINTTNNWLSTLNSRFDNPNMQGDNLLNRMNIHLSHIQGFTDDFYDDFSIFSMSWFDYVVPWFYDQTAKADEAVNDYESSGGLSVSDISSSAGSFSHDLGNVFSVGRDSDAFDSMQDAEGFWSQSNLDQLDTVEVPSNGGRMLVMASSPYSGTFIPDFTADYWLHFGG